MAHEELWWARYNSEVIAVVCPRESCRAGVNQRCRGSLHGVTVAHHVRIKAAGWRWDKEQQVLVRLTS